MLVTNVNSISDQSIADRMRSVAELKYRDEGLVDQAIDEAVITYRTTRNSAKAIDAGVKFLEGIGMHEGGGRARTASAESPKPVQGAWVEHWGVIAVGIVLAAAILVASAFGAV